MLFDTQAEHYDETSGLPPEAGEAVARAVRTWAGSAPNDLVLEIGAGTGAVGQHLAALPGGYLGLELSRPMLDEFGRKCAVTQSAVAQADANHTWPVGDGSVAVVFASRVVHLLDAAHFVNEVWRVCQPGGCLLLGRVTRDADSFRGRLQRLKRDVLAEYGVTPQGGGQAVRAILDACAARGATPLEPQTVAVWTRTRSAREVLANWEAKPRFGNSVPATQWREEMRPPIVAALAERARRAFGDLDTPHEYAEQYTLEGVRLPPRDGA